MRPSSASGGAVIALNPIQWMATDDGWIDPSVGPEPGDLLALVKRSGFDSVMTDVPAGWSTERYRETVADAGLTPAPGYLVARFDTPGVTERAVLDAAARAAAQHAALGLSDIGLGLPMSKEGPRLRHPARGVAPSSERLDAVVGLVDKISAVMVSEGVRPAFHPHVATWVETEDETRAVLEAFDDTRLGFLPDTGHLSWAGTDVKRLVADYADRIPFIHVKDCRLSVAKRGFESDWDYRRVVLEGVWVEPGRGELDLVDILSGLSPSFTGWLMVEVDRPDLPDPYECAEVSASWMRQTFN